MQHPQSTILIVVLLTFAGCARTPESLITRQIAILDEAASTLSTITDDASANEAAPRLGKLQQELNALVPRVKALNLTSEAKKELEDEHRKELDTALAKYETELARVRKLKLKTGGLSALDDAVVE